MMRFLMRGFDRLKIVTTPRKRPRHIHRPASYDFSELTRPEYLANAHAFYTSHPPLDNWRHLDTTAVEDGIVRDSWAYRSNFELPGGHDFNQLGRAWHTRRTDGPDTVMASMIVLPGWGRRELDRELDVCRNLARGGLETLTLTLPYHLTRSVPGGFSGEYMISAEVARTARCFQQTVAETRGAVPWLRQHTPAGRPVGLLGISLGGILAHLAMTVEPLDFGISMIAGGQAARITWESPVTRYIRQDIIRAGINLPLLEQVWAAASPTRYAHQALTRRILMLVGRHDDIVPVQYAEELWQALGRPEIRRYPVAHYSAFFWIDTMVRDILDFVAATPGAIKPVLGSCGP